MYKKNILIALTMIFILDCFPQNVKYFKGNFLKFRIVENCGKDCFDVSEFCFFINDIYDANNMTRILDLYKKNKVLFFTELLKCPIICMTEFIVKKTIVNTEIDTSFIRRYNSISNFIDLDEFYIEPKESNYYLTMKYSVSLFQDSVCVILYEIDNKWWGCHKIKMSNFGYLHVDYKDKDSRFFYFPIQAPH